MLMYCHFARATENLIQYNLDAENYSRCREMRYEGKLEFVLSRTV